MFPDLLPIFLDGYEIKSGSGLGMRLVSSYSPSTTHWSDRHFAQVWIASSWRKISLALDGGHFTRSTVSKSTLTRSTLMSTHVWSTLQYFQCWCISTLALTSLVPRLPCSRTQTLKLCRCGELGIFSHVKIVKGREGVQRPIVHVQSLST